MTARVPLTQGRVALIDDEDLARVLAAGTWCATVKPRTAYAVRMARKPDGRPTTIGMHRFITGWEYVDHINGDGLDNRRCNLRPATAATNARNVGLRSHNTSGYKGVTWHKAGRKWMAQLRVDGRQVYLGLFTDPAEAASAYDAAALEHFGEFARTNAELHR